MPVPFYLTLAVFDGAAWADEHFLDDFLAETAGIVRVVLLALAIFAGANKSVGAGTV